MRVTRPWIRWSGIARCRSAVRVERAGIPWHRVTVTLLGCGTLATALGGCAPHRPPLLTAPEPPVVWPLAPDQPRVRFLDEVKGSTDLQPRKTFNEVCDEILTGPPAPSMLSTPYAIAVHPDGVRFAIADTGAACVHVFNMQTQEYERFEGAGTPPRRFESPVAVAWVGESIWVADSRIHAVGSLRLSEPSPERKRKTPGPWSSRSQSRSPTASGEQKSAGWVGSDQLKRPAGLAFCQKNGLVYVSDAGAHAIVAFEQSGRMVLQFGTHGSGEGQFNCPSHLACTDDSLFVIDSLNSRVQRMGLDGSPMGVFGRKGDAAGDLALPKGVAVDASGNLWIVDAHFENVQAFTPDGKLLMAMGDEGRQPGQFWLPGGACIDSRNRLWIADSYNRRVQVFQLLQ